MGENSRGNFESDGNKKTLHPSQPFNFLSSNKPLNKLDTDIRG